ncbi:MULTISPECIES: YceI family protein [Streptosporangium]|uniref:Polyisoprenoid-binding protein YceI n=1 Tax=Streptosporangium brasiliense TaxID=47480 RepID=A0ABT9R7I7_9ACTN|nr:YceI family protein [Streptosporangium brasiliense]MDP9864847.1 polyisoprenoid-binding protein YceI [Streptosporangium brasiliense]
MVGVTTGSYTLGPESGRLLVNTARSGLGAKAGHDLTIEVTRWHGEATVDTTDPAGSSVTVEIDAGSFEVREGTGGVKPLTGSDRREIEKILREKILHTGRNPMITFRSTRVDGTAESFRVEGDLTIVGVTQPVEIQGSLAGSRAQGSATIVQTRWGIRPYSALFGALKVGDGVEIRFDADLTPKR